MESWSKRAGWLAHGPDSRRFKARIATIALAALVLSACASENASEPVERAPRSTAAVRHWPLPPAELERALRTERIEILEARYAGAGLTGAQRMRLRLVERDGFEIQAKWKPMPGRMDGVNNSPRKELAAYAVQKLFLAPEDYVVPTSVARCLPLEAFPDPDKHRAGPLDGLSCELGVFSAWLDGVHLPERLYDPERFEADRVYARHLGHFNLATYLMLHQDGRGGNFLVSENEADRRVFAVDNGVAFSGIFYNWFVLNWKSIHVPAIPRAACERLARVTIDDVRALATVEELQRTPSGGMESRPAGPVLEPGRGVRINGDVLQLGLTDAEIRGLWKRLEAVLEDVEDGEIRILEAAAAGS